MAIRMKALKGQSGSLNSTTEQHSLRWDVYDDATRYPDPLTLYAYALANIPPTFNTRGLTNASYEEDEDGGFITVTGDYTSREAPESLLKISFDTTGGTVRARTSRATTAFPVTGRTAPDYKGAVEVSDGEPQGVDVAIPALKLVFSYKWPRGVIDLNSVRQIASLTGTTNLSPWYGFQRGELLFLGATGQIDLTLPTEVSYNFAASANATLAIGSWITGIVKAGHQHLWVAFEDFEDTAAKKLVQRPLAAYVETLYTEADFSAFGIGG